MKSYTFDYEIHDHNNDDVLREQTATYNATSYGAAFELFSGDKSILAEYIKEQCFLEDSEEWTSEQIEEGSMSDEDVVRNYFKLYDEDKVFYLAILLIV